MYQFYLKMQMNGHFVSLLYKFNESNAIRSMSRIFLQDLYSILLLLTIRNFHVIRLKRIRSVVILLTLVNVMDAAEVILLSTVPPRRSLLAMSNFTGIIIVVNQRHSSKRILDKGTQVVMQVVIRVVMYLYICVILRQYKRT